MQAHTNYQLHPDRGTPVQELQFEHLDGKYKYVQMAGVASTYLFMAMLALLLLLIDNRLWWIMAECITGISLVANMFILSKACLFKGYALREHDISYRSGIIFPKVTTIPYNRIQQVSVEQNPMAKFFRLYSVEVVNGAQHLSSLTIPGLTEEMADQIKSLVLDKISHAHD